MRQSKFFTKTRKEVSADEVSRNAELLIRAGFVHKEMAGVYSYLPLGLRVLRKIENIIREEMDNVGGQEVLLSSFQPKENWEKTGRWESMDDLYKVVDSSGREVALGPTHEEIVVPILKNYVSSHKDFPSNPPLSIYQIQNKFRMELRAKSGMLRGREFLMKDMYSFHTSKKDFEEFYTKMQGVYKTIFSRVGIGHLTYMTFASGGTFSKYSHEFQTISSVGEDTIYVDEASNLALNKEVLNDEVLSQLNLKKEKLVEQKSIEVGNIFDLKTKYSKPFDLSFTDSEGEKHIVLMGCYGIGLSRLLGTVVEVLSDDKGIIWPESIAPYAIHLLLLGEDENVKKEAEKIYETLKKSGIEVLFDDRGGVTAGEKFADSDLFGIPLRVVVSVRSIKEGGVEIKKRNEEKGKVVSLDDLLKICSKNSTN
ncbi:MAG: Proline-tRNA ligase [Parcubacteria group bacterium GW2011_GWC1_35_8]|uniref:Proline--tRNA ligase n=3 Tax=Candidatus Nomuraibacteriota TaxID=1752729 RepID=A0A1F6YTQ3_9BACT|nr:MAG: Proline-tRNA ligase [Parcubacteria group bacterium GW2011_GWC1_35_8]KKP89828.1 MAG: Proline-tRNA ligase [Candidatus Nomurabacteria bacterium GW2011_GWC2_35_8]OGJ05548.1 MAG: prolyl-tRNA synthetase [Candidatus Nomurabacteria bacterium RIFOXYA2_FULL_35_9]OGJ06130.1 MAG: prolyl-tRNA synthetase [Candidatus Nomurabacteria bacterium RIFOXYA1_FULL_35_17]OGJ09717.1 MAG: prolyl-tRNA synthetase [Candidatus Nomurabacteria bacterium RIFOXYC2_FULL_36_19]OGJ14563.1 MAG: prolyl-tRNA synthetase [Candi